jgi:adenylate cyclase class IV
MVEHMRPGAATHGWLTYRVPVNSVAELLRRLHQDGRWLGIDAEAEVFLDHPLLRLADRSQSLVLRLRVGHGFGELRMDGDDQERATVEVYAAGPIERLLRAMGFRTVFRLVTLRQQYQFGAASVRLLHVEPLGWYCEVENDGTAQRELEDQLGIAGYAKEPASFGDLARAAAPELDRRQSQRRHANRRSPSLIARGAERRAGRERRVDDRRHSGFNLGLQG